MKHDNENDSIIDLGAVSVETKGATGVPEDFGQQIPLAGLQDD